VLPDSQTCIKWSEASVGGSERAKHVHLRLHLVHDAVAAKAPQAQQDLEQAEWRGYSHSADHGKGHARRLTPPTHGSLSLSAHQSVSGGGGLLKRWEPCLSTLRRCDEDVWVETSRSGRARGPRRSRD